MSRTLSPLPITNKSIPTVDETTTTTTNSYTIHVKQADEVEIGKNNFISKTNVTTITSSSTNPARKRFVNSRDTNVTLLTQN
jgi:hypothetical protein